ncbi:MAG: hypothetical protein GXP29_15730 [Planctomycetes bacterium]|nr:hypothetical protein [Planctomycetota bacterium]
MQLTSIPKFLLGDRQAILDIARSKNGLLVGALLVLSAGFAREYDAEYLVMEPWHVLIPLGASLLVALPMFALLFVIGKRRGIGKVQFFKAFRSFLVLFWMTAPLAWVYAIPFERFLDPIGATYANLWMLRIVSIWRVALMTHVVSVFFGCKPVPAFFCVILVADIAMQVALDFAPFPVINFMGGIRVSDTANIVANAASVMTLFGILSLPIWLIGVLVVICKTQPTWSVVDLTPQAPFKSQPAITLAATAVLAWFTVLPWTQAEQRLRYETESLLIDGQIAKGLAVMSQHQKNHYPPLWDPPPRPHFRVYEPNILDVMLVMLDEPPADWVRPIYDEKFERWLGTGGRYRYRRLSVMKVEDFERTLSILERIPAGSEYAVEMMPAIEAARDRLGDALVNRAKKLADQN